MALSSAFFASSWRLAAQCDARVLLGQQRHVVGAAGGLNARRLVEPVEPALIAAESSSWTI